MKSIAASFLVSFALFTPLSSQLIQLEEDCICGSTEKLIRASVRHIEAGGVGYNKGYTSLGLFLAPFQPLRDAWDPFVDLRGHVFNNGKFAANVGIGVRYLSCRVWGINGYYDYRNTKHRSYNQLSLGLESLGKRWDFRLNGYLPIGKNRYEHESDNSFKKEFAMSGIDAEFGVYLRKLCDGSLYLAAGPYYLHDSKKNGGGGMVRVVAEFLSYIRLEGIASWDSIFKTKIQGQVGLIFPFGPIHDVCKRRGFSCSQSLSQRRIALRDVSRKEIIVIREKHGKNRLQQSPIPVITTPIFNPLSAVVEIPPALPIEEEQPGLISRAGSYLWSWVPKPWTWF